MTAGDALVGSFTLGRFSVLTSAIVLRTQTWVDSITPSGTDGSVQARRTTTDVKTSFYLPAATLRALKAKAVREGVSLRVLLLRAIDALLDKAPRRRGAR